MKEYDFDPRNLPPDILQAMGLITACYAQTESVLEAGIGGCAGVEIEYSLAITTHMNGPLRDHVLRAVAQIRLDNLDALDELDTLLDEIKKAATKRNLHVHNCFCRDPENGDIFVKVVHARGEVDAELIPVSVKAMREDAAFIYKSGMDLMTFLMRHKLFPKFPPAPRPRVHKSKAARKKRREDLLRRTRSK